MLVADAAFPRNVVMPSSSSVVRSSEKCVNPIPLCVPGVVYGETTMVATWLPLPESSSSQVMNRTVLPAWYEGLATICGTQLCSQASPVCTEQSCMSLQRSGVTKLNFGKVPALSAEVNAPLEVVPIGTLSVPHAGRIFV